MRVPSSAELDTDFNYLRSVGIDGVRIFPNWQHYGCPVSPPSSDDALFTTSGAIRESSWVSFLRVLDRAAANGLIVNVTFTRETVTGTASDISMANYRAQIVEVAHRLKGAYPHVLFDLQNEYDNGPRLGLEDLATIAAAVRAEDPLFGPRRLMTVSTTGGASALAAATAHDALLSVAALHDGRGSNWYTTAAVSAAISSGVDAMGASVAPIYLEEPTPFSGFPDCAPNGADSTPGHARQAVAAAKAAGAAAWTFHTRTAFRLSDGNYRSKLESLPGEREELEALRGAADAATWGATIATPSVPTLTVNGKSTGTLSVAVNDQLSIEVSGGPATPGDWVGLFRRTANPRQAIDYRFLSGTQVLPGVGVSFAAISMRASQTGQFEVRFYKDRDFLLLKASVPISVIDPHPTGRYKVGPEGCYWEPNDSGPNQCTPPPVEPGDILRSNEVLTPDHGLTSVNNKYRFYYGFDGNLVVYRLFDGATLWASGTRVDHGTLEMQAGGKLVLSDASGVSQWSRPTEGYPGSSLTMQWDGNLVLYDPSGIPRWSTQTQQTDPSPDAPGPVPTGTDAVQYYDTDVVGSVRMITDAAGGVVARYDYTPFGGEVSNPTVQDTRRFAGKERDQESGFDYFGARYFSKEIGRFIRVDPGLDFERSLLSPQRWNRYVYALNNPLRFNDPDGRYVTDCAIDDAECQERADRFETARQEAFRSSKSDVKAAAEAFGKPNEKNGIFIHFNINSGSKTSALGSAPGVVKIDVWVSDYRDNRLERAIAHEGTHVVDDERFIKSGFDQRYNMTNFQSELHAFAVGAEVMPYDYSNAACSGRPCGIQFGPNDKDVISDFLRKSDDYRPYGNNFVFNR
jgi:RHS repeat-associated protein